MANRKRVLVADIDDHLLIKLQILLETRGYDILTAWGAREAIQLLESQEFDLVLLDDYLPDASGEELLRAVQHQPPRTSVALLRTSQPVQSAQSHFLRLGGRCLLDKTAPDKIAQSVHECLSRNVAGGGHRPDLVSQACGRY
jgi:DNA-binding NtrC family response regulator